MIGGVGAYLFFTNSNYVKYLSGNFLTFISIMFVLFNVYYVPELLQNGIHIINSFCFLIIILNASVNPNSMFKIENSIFNKLGNVSYGIYMYHFMIIPMVIIFFEKGLNVNNFDAYWVNIGVYFLVFSITILLSILSFEFFEKKILKFKRNYSS
jgi:peptidoglycan/LPS O-acetylase OafA/YrhL